MSYRAVVILVLLLGLFSIAATRGGRAQVTIAGGRMTPATLTIAPGDTVVWHNADDRDHSIAAEDGSFASPKIKSGQSYEHRFTREGSYNYSCTLHPRERGRIIVKK
jgi:plastocyanin